MRSRPMPRRSDRRSRSIPGSMPPYLSGWSVAAASSVWCRHCSGILPPKCLHMRILITPQTARGKSPSNRQNQNISGEESDVPIDAEWPVLGGTDRSGDSRLGKLPHEPRNRQVLPGGYAESNDLAASYTGKRSILFTQKPERRPSLNSNDAQGTGADRPCAVRTVAIPGFCEGLQDFGESPRHTVQHELLST